MKPVAIVTGGSTGIGRSICEHLLAAGHRVYALSRRPTDIDHPDLAALLGTARFPTPSNLPDRTHVLEITVTR